MSELGEKKSPGSNDMPERSKDENELVINYLNLRRTVGWIGTLLPVVLIAGNAIFFTTDLPGSMSGYYYTHMRDVFVGALCALGVFLISYAGYDEWDRWITNIAGACAIATALCATKPTVCAANQRSCAPPAVRAMSTAQNFVGTIHLVFAMVTFLALGVMALRFAKLPTTKDDKWPPGFWDRVRFVVGLPPSGQAHRGVRPDRRSAALFRGCGSAIIVCVVLAAVSNFLPGSIKDAVPLLFILEALAVFSFGISWFAKGQTLKPVVRLAARLSGNAPAAPTPPPAPPPPALPLEPQPQEP
jgi:hypothetical protein